MWTIEWDITATWTIIRMDSRFMDTLFLSRVVLGRERVNILHSFPMRCVSNAGQCNNWRGQQQPKQKERGRVSQSQKNKIPFSLSWHHHRPYPTSQDDFSGQFFAIVILLLLIILIGFAVAVMRAGQTAGETDAAVAVVVRGAAKLSGGQTAAVSPSPSVEEEGRREGRGCHGHGRV